MHFTYLVFLECSLSFQGEDSSGDGGGCRGEESVEVWVEEIIFTKAETCLEELHGGWSTSCMDVGALWVCGHFIQPCLSKRSKMLFEVFGGYSKGL